MKSLLRIVAVLSALVASVPATGAEKIHELRPSAATVHRGFFDATQKPVLTDRFGRHRAYLDRRRAIPSTTRLWVCRRRRSRRSSTRPTKARKAISGSTNV